MHEDLIIKHIIEWRTIRVIVSTDDLAILKHQLSEVCDYIICDEAGQGRHFQVLTLSSRMLIKSLSWSVINTKYNHIEWVN